MAALLLICGRALHPQLYRRPPSLVRDSLPGVGTSAGAGDASDWGFLADDLSPRRRGRANAVEPHSSRFDMGADVLRPFRRPRPEPLRVEVRRRLAAAWTAPRSHAGAAPDDHLDFLRPDDGRQRDHAERCDIVEDRSDIGPNGRAAEQLLRGVRGARRSARHFFTRDRDPVLGAATGEVKITVKDVSPETIQTSGTTVSLRKFTVVLHNVGADLDATIAIDARNRFARL